MYQCSQANIDKTLSALNGNRHVPVADNGQCVRLVQTWCSVPAPAHSWKPGAKVKGNVSLRAGTAIATFIDGKYPNLSHGNHAAIYLSQSVHGIVVLDQWTGKDGLQRGIRKRVIRFSGFGSPSDDGEQFYVIE